MSFYFYHTIHKLSIFLNFFTTTNSCKIEDELAVGNPMWTKRPVNLTKTTSFHYILIQLTFPLYLFLFSTFLSLLSLPLSSLSFSLYSNLAFTGRRPPPPVESRASPPLPQCRPDRERIGVGLEVGHELAAAGVGLENGDNWRRSFRHAAVPRPEGLAPTMIGKGIGVGVGSLEWGSWMDLPSISREIMARLSSPSLAASLATLWPQPLRSIGAGILIATLSMVASPLVECRRRAASAAITYCSYAFGFYLSSVFPSVVNKVTALGAGCVWKIDQRETEEEKK